MSNFICEKSDIEVYVGYNQRCHIFSQNAMNVGTETIGADIMEIFKNNMKVSETLLFLKKKTGLHCKI